MICNSEWLPVDFDGLKLMLRPGPRRLAEQTTHLGYSKASKRQMIRRRMAATRESTAATGSGAYVVMDVETTGLSPEWNEIIELSALRVIDHCVADRFDMLVRVNIPLPAKIVELTGITDSLLQNEGQDLRMVLPAFLAFIRDDLLVAHNIGFDMAFLKMACEKCELTPPANKIEDTLALSRKRLYNLKNHSLSGLMAHFGICADAGHRGLADCHAAMAVYEKLINLS